MHNTNQAQQQEMSFQAMFNKSSDKFFSNYQELMKNYHYHEVPNTVVGEINGLLASCDEPLLAGEQSKSRNQDINILKHS